MSEQQLMIFTEPTARHDDPETSVNAAKKAKWSHTGRLAKIAEIVDKCGYWGATADDIYLHVAAFEPKAVRSTWHRAVSSAAQEGLIIPRGDKHVRLSVNDTAMRIYITPKWLP